MIPYGRQTIEEDDIQAVVETLRSDWLTTGPLVESFERDFADFVGTKFAVAVSNGTAALHSAMYAIGIKGGDEVIVSPMTFAASVNCVVFQGGMPVFADVDFDTLLVSPAEVESKITPRTKAIIAVDYAGHPCDYDELKKIADYYTLTNIFTGNRYCYLISLFLTKIRSPPRHIIHYQILFSYTTLTTGSGMIK
jgi:Predicted pyridoxal phosphate-dependent enzyme apparently involved in regulation of cell wall biogenesis